MAQLPVIQQPERPKEFGDLGTITKQNELLSIKQEIPSKNSLLQDPIKSTVPTIDAQSSSLMEGSGVFDPSDLSNTNFLPHGLSEMSNMKIIKNEESDKGQVKLQKDFEPTNLLVNIDNEQSMEVNTL